MALWYAAGFAFLLETNFLITGTSSILACELLMALYSETNERCTWVLITINASQSILSLNEAGDRK